MMYGCVHRPTVYPSPCALCLLDLEEDRNHLLVFSDEVVALLFSSPSLSMVRLFVRDSTVIRKIQIDVLRCQRVEVVS